MHVVIHDQGDSFQMTCTTAEMLMQMYLCVAVFTVAVIFYLFMQELNKLFTMFMHFNLVHERVKTKVKCCVSRHRHQTNQGVRNGSCRVNKQQIHVFACSCIPRPWLQQRAVAYRCVL